MLSPLVPRFTSIGADGSPFTGTTCADGDQTSVNIVNLQEGPIPISGGKLELGEQVIQYECTPNCTASNYTIIPESKIYVKQFSSYIVEQSQKYGYATMSDGRPVHDVIARMGIFLHWIADRSSHWYCTDAPGTGIVGVKKTQKKYDLYMWVSMLKSLISLCLSSRSKLDSKN